MELCTQLGHVDLIAEAYAALARVQLAQRDFNGARGTIKLADLLSRETKLDPWAVCWLDDCRLRLWLATGDLVEPLTERELDVLRLLKTSLSATEIAEELVVAPSTLRTHSKSIYSKLGVHRWMEAVERAGELGLF